MVMPNTVLYSHRLWVWKTPGGVLHPYLILYILHFGVMCICNNQEEIGDRESLIRVTRLSYSKCFKDCIRTRAPQLMCMSLILRFSIPNKEVMEYMRPSHHLAISAPSFTVSSVAIK